MRPKTKRMLAEVQEMNLSELDEFLSQVLTISAERKAPRLSHIESELMLRINQGVPKTLLDRANELNHKRREGQLSSAEHAELLSVNDQIESLEVERVRDLAELAQIRAIPFQKLVDDLHLPSDRA